LNGNGLTSDQVTAAQQFRDFLRTPNEQAWFASAGLRVASSTAHPDSSPGMDWGNAAEGPSPTDAASYQQLVASVDGGEVAVIVTSMTDWTAISNAATGAAR